MKRIYLDHAATTPLHPEVLEAMMPLLTDIFGNPSSIHSFGREAKMAVEEARDRAAELLGCGPDELVFTSGGTESDNLAIFGAASSQPEKKHVITSSIEHQAVLNSCRELEKKGYEVTYVPVDRNGRIDVADVKNAIREDTVMISIMYGNNETGTVQPIEEIGRLSREKGVLFHVDAVQALGVVPLRLRDLPVDLVSFSAHKINGPKGAGILYVSSGTRIRPLLFGGAQESGQRAGTENPAGIVGMVKAVERAVFNMNEKRKHFDQLVEEMSSVLNEQLGDQRWVINGHPRERLPHICNISFPGVETETLLMNLDLEGVAASSGSACSSGSLQVSHVLKAMDLPGEIIRSAVRFSFGPDTTAEEVREAAKKTATIVRRLS